MPDVYLVYLRLSSCFIDKPGKPNNLTVSKVMKDSMVLSWQPPTHTGGSDITAYIIEKRDAKRNTWTQVEKVPGLTNTVAVQKLLEGNEYYFRVSAENDIGQGEPLELEAPIMAKSPYGRIFLNNHFLFQSGICLKKEKERYSMWKTRLFDWICKEKLTY